MRYTRIKDRVILESIDGKHGFYVEVVHLQAAVRGLLNELNSGAVQGGVRLKAVRVAVKKWLEPYDD